MLISSSSSALANLQLYRQPDTAEAAAPAASPVREKPVQEEKEAAPPSEVVNLTAPAGSPYEAPTGVYAEIWKDGLKVAIVDQHGSVTSLTAGVPPSIGSGGGMQVAARRAAQIATAIGGEIHSLGTIVTPQTLTMRARLQAAYGV